MAYPPLAALKSLCFSTSSEGWWSGPWRAEQNEWPFILLRPVGTFPQNETRLACVASRVCVFESFGLSLYTNRPAKGENENKENKPT
jgi:hypothetical protein